MKKFWEKVEHYNSKLITPALILLLGVIIFELFLHVENHTIELAVKMADWIIITIFVIDLIFLAKRSRNAKFFFKNYWLDIIAVFPFVIFFNVFNSLYKFVIATERIVVGQAIFHETVEASKGIKSLSRGEKLLRGVRIAARGLRVVTKSRLFKIGRAHV